MRVRTTRGSGQIGYRLTRRHHDFGYPHRRGNPVRTFAICVLATLAADTGAAAAAWADGGNTIAAAAARAASVQITKVRSEWPCSCGKPKSWRRRVMR